MGQDNHLSKWSQRLVCSPIMTSFSMNSWILLKVSLSYYVVVAVIVVVVVVVCSLPTVALNSNDTISSTV